MAIDLITAYSPHVDEMFKQESKRSLLTNQDYTWMGAKTVKAYKISTADMNDYGRNSEIANGSRYGRALDLDATTETMTLRKDRSFTFVIDKLDKEETGNVALAGASALARQQREVIIPEVDKYVYEQMATNAGTKAVSVKLTDANIYDEIIKGSETLDNAEVPDEGRVIVVTPEVYRLIKKNPDINLSDALGDELKKKGVVGSIDGMAVIKVPAVRLPNKFGFMIAHPSATVSPVKLDEYKIHQDPPGISGELVEGRICYDAFVLDNKKKAIYYMENKTE